LAISSTRTRVRTATAIQLRFLQTMREISSEYSTTTFLPVPIDLFTPLLKAWVRP